MTLPSLYGLVGPALLLASGAVKLARARHLRPAARIGLLLAAFAAGFARVHGLPVAGYLRALTGDFAIMTSVLLAGCSVSHLLNRELYCPRSLTKLSWLVAAGALALYPFTLGLTTFDPYRLGYDSRVFLVLVGALALWAAHRKVHLIALGLACSVLAHSLGVMESRNLWDYLMDPWLSLYAAGHLSRGWLRRSAAPL